MDGPLWKAIMNYELWIMEKMSPLRGFCLFVLWLFYKDVAANAALEKQLWITNYGRTAIKAGGQVFRNEGKQRTHEKMQAR
jgi:hypothetical protein